MSETRQKETRPRGQVIPRGNKTFLVRVPKPSAKGGRRRYFNKTLHNTTEAKAWKYVDKVFDQMADGTFFEPSKESVEGLLKRWLKHVARQGVRQITLDSYEDTVKVYLTPALGHIPLAQLTALEIQDAFDGMVDRGLAPLTIRNARRILSRALTKAVKWGLLNGNPAVDIETPKGGRKKHRAMTEEEATKFIATAREDPEDLIFIFVLFTGLRPVEFIGLQWPCVELVREFDPRREQYVERGLARIRRTIVRPRLGGGWQWSDPKTEAGARDAYFPAAIYHDLMKHKDRQERQKRLMGKAYHDHDLVFASNNGEPLHRDALGQSRFKPLIRRARLPEEFSLYTLRRTFATLATAAGASRLGRSAQMGHADPDFTDDVYVTTLPSMQKSVSDALENLLFGEFRTLPAHNPVDRLM